MDTMEDVENSFNYIQSVATKIENFWDEKKPSKFKIQIVDSIGIVF